MAQAPKTQTPDDQDIMLLLQAAMRGEIRGFEEFVTHFGVKALADACDREGYTALMYAQEKNISAEKQMAATLWLLDHGMPVDAVNRYNSTALHIAAGTGRADVVRLLLDRGADPETVNADGFSAIHFAVGNKEIEQMLREEPLNRLRRARQDAAARQTGFGVPARKSPPRPRF